VKQVHEHYCGQVGALCVLATVSSGQWMALCAVRVPLCVCVCVNGSTVVF